MRRIDLYEATTLTAGFTDLTVHHTIEERHIFPVLAKRMPAFQNDEVHIKSHHGIHEGATLCIGQRLINKLSTTTKGLTNLVSSYPNGTKSHPRTRRRR